MTRPTDKSIGKSIDGTISTETDNQEAFPNINAGAAMKTSHENLDFSKLHPISTPPVMNHTSKKKESKENQDNESTGSIAASISRSGRHNPNRPIHRNREDGISATTTFSLLHEFSRATLRVALGATVALYILNQNHMLPKPLSAYVSRTLFWPTLPITVSKRIGKWCTVVDDTVVLGGAPFGFANVPERLHENYGIRGVINMCEEYRGPVKKYKKLGIEELCLPTIDHFEPSVEDIKKAVDFIEKYKNENKGKVYVHCRAGHGRSAAIVYAWLLFKSPNQNVDMQELNAQLCSLRNVRKTLWKQPNINEFRSWLHFGRIGSSGDGKDYS